MGFSSVPKGTEVKVNEFYRYPGGFGSGEITFRKWTLNSTLSDQSYYMKNYDREPSPFKLEIRNCEVASGNPTLSVTASEEDSMANKIARNLYFIAVVNKTTDETDIQYVVAADQTAARDVIVQERLAEGIKAKDVDINFLSTSALTPRTEKD